jgi:hypothetical protein
VHQAGSGSVIKVISGFYVNFGEFAKYDRYCCFMITSSLAIILLNLVPLSDGGRKLYDMHFKLFFKAIKT